MKVGDVVIPSLGWLSQDFYDAEQFGVGVIISVSTRSIVKFGSIQDTSMCLIVWSGFGVFNSWEYDFELEVISESR